MDLMGQPGTMYRILQTLIFLFVLFLLLQLVFEALDLGIQLFYLMSAPHTAHTHTSHTHTRITHTHGGGGGGGKN